MTLDDFKNGIEERTGIPTSLLTADTEDGCIAQAENYLAFKKEHEATRPKSTREQFADWMSEKEGREKADPALEGLAQIKEQNWVDQGGFPKVHDGGNVLVNDVKFGDSRTPREQFAAWLKKQTQFDPTKDSDGWKRVN